ncbi:MAG: flmD [Stygiobacter sp.]|nr:MAG: flmD [Stygiobacter sp.]
MNPKAANILVRADGGKIWGLSMGHIYRTLAVAQELRDHHGLTCRFLLRDIPEAVAMVRDHGFCHDLLPAEAKAAAESEAAALARADEPILLVDRPDPPPNGFGHFIRPNRRLVIIGPTGDKAQVPVDLWIDDLRPPSPDLPAHAMLGPRFAIMSKDFDGKFRDAVAPYARNLLVTFGGSDPAGLTARVVATLLESCLDMSMQVVLGPAFGDDADVIAAVAGDGRFVVKRNIPDLCTAMLAADIVIAAAGRTALELAITGTPSLMVPSIDTEFVTAPYLEACGSTRMVDPRRADFPDRLRAELVSLAANHSARDGMRLAGRALVDGNGRQRVGDAIATLLQKSRLTKTAVRS